MPTVTLPNDPTLDALSDEAARLREHVSEYSLVDAQAEVARAHGFEDWAAVGRYFAVVDARRWEPGSPPPAAEPAAHRFLRLACLTYTDDDGPQRWSEAGRLLAGHSVTDDIWAASAAADAPAVARLLSDDPGLATRTGGPYGWMPLCYLAYSRVRPGAADPVLSARLLLEAGAEVNEGYLWHGLPTPFTVLAGVFGEGEQGPGREPRHPRSRELASLLLAAGADPNDGQALYNRMFGTDDDHLELLLPAGLGTGDGGPWRQLLGAATDSPAELVAKQLAWAAAHGRHARLELFARYGFTR
ncbi:hypothetical protein [Cryptosporangium sp. NPDC048952]|uniref:hypothetical protein n=1 Tax=Cryptosporangium sp. NPDC048952 TaxID=3363961 RepID=UPI00371B515C